MYLVLGGTWSGGCTWSGGVHLVPGGVPGWRGTWSQGVPGPGVHLVGGVHLVPGRGCTWSGTPPCGQTDACKNITFATSLRTVITN